MNKSFHSVWNASKQAYVAAAETVSAKGKPSSGVKLAAFMAGLMGSLLGTIANAQIAPPPNTLPTGGQLSAGQASISTNGANMVINQSSNRAAINWQTFNVGKDAHVQFQQPSAASVTLNRVMTSDPSQIFGRISANGQVVLTNPAGVYFSPSARVDVGGIVATTHGMSDADFMAGKNRYERNGSTGSVVNEGELKASLGSYIALLAPEVRNQGAIIAQMGTVALASGEAIDLKFDSNNRLTSLRVEPSQIAALVDNRHAVQAPGGLVIISAQSMNQLVGGVVRNSGRIEANGLQQQGGRLVLSASTKVDNTGSISANATAEGPAGKIEISAPSVSNSGSISATGNTQHSAGSVLVQATNFTQTATGSIELRAPMQGGQLKIQTTGNANLQGSMNTQATQDRTSEGTATQGGQIDIAAQGDIEVNNATLDASGGQGGAIALRAKAPSQPDNPNPLPDAPGQGRLAIMGNSTLSIRGRSGNGGSATLLGDQIDLLDTTHIDATGSAGGGNVLVGGDWQGSNGVYQATTVTMAEGVSIDASATMQGDGGKVVLWSDVNNPNSVTTAQGTVLAKGGALGGNGGQVETSGHQLQVENITISTVAPMGTTGQWLLDPYDITISAGTQAGVSSSYTGTANSAVINVSTLQTALGTNNVTVATGSSGTQNGDITVASAINSSSANSLTLTASRNIAINAPLALNGSFTANAGVTISLGANVITSGAQQYTGNVTVSATNVALSTLGNGSAGNALGFSGNINGATANANNLYLLSGSGALNVAGSVGNIAALGTLGLGYESVSVAPVTQTFNYTASYQTFTATSTGTYTFSVWGAQGGGGGGGLGGYANGTYNLIAGQTIVVAVGGRGSYSGGWNGGGWGGSYSGYGGGGATDIRLDYSTNNRLLVAGGGGGMGGYSSDAIFVGGGGAAGSAGGTGSMSVPGYGGEAGGIANGGLGGAVNTYLSICNTCALTSNTSGGGGGGGGGYYGGGGGGGGTIRLKSSNISGGIGANGVLGSGGNGGANATSTVSWYGGGGGGGGGGSSWAGGVAGGVTASGNASMPNPAGGSMTGNTGNGYAMITAAGGIAYVAGAQTGTITIGSGVNASSLLTAATNFQLKIGQSVAASTSTLTTDTTLKNTGGFVMGTVTNPHNLVVTGSFATDTSGVAQLNGGVTTTTTQTYGGAVLLLGDTTLTSIGASSINGAVSGSASFTKAGSGTLTLAGANSYIGATTISAGTLKVTGSLADGTAVSIASGATYDVSATDAVGSLAGAGSVLLGSGITLTAGGLNTSTSLSGAMSGAGAFTKAGTGTLTLSGLNTYTGGTTISAGTLALGASNVLADAGSVNVSGGTFSVGTFNDTVGAISVSTGSISGSTGVLTGSSYASTDGGTVSAILTGTGSLTKTGAGTLTLSGANTYSGTTTVSAGTLQVGAGGTSGTLGLGSITNNAGLVFNRTDNVTVANAIGGAGSLTQQGSGTLTLTQNNTFTGTNTIANGVLVLSNNAPNPSSKNFTGTGQLRIEPATASNSFTSPFSTLGWTFASTLTGLTLGKSSNTADMTVANAIGIAGPIGIYGGNIAINAGLVTTALLDSNAIITLKGSGNVTDGASGFVQAGQQTTLGQRSGSLLLLGGNVTLDNSANNDVGTVAASGVSGLTYLDYGGLIIGTVGSTSGVSATGVVDIGSQIGSLRVSKDVVTTNASATALTLNASIGSAVGADLLSNILISSSPSYTPTISVGSGGIGRLYTGGITTDSQRVSQLSGLTAGHFRYNADETANFSTGGWTALGAGINAIYRQQPSATVTLASKSMTYGDALPTLTGSVSGAVNGDSVNYVINSRLNSSSGNIKVGSYTLTETGLAGLGYSMSVTNATLSVAQKALTLTGLLASDKTYNRDATAIISSYGTLSGVMGSGASTDAISLVTTGVTAANRTFDDWNAGVNKTVSVSGLSLSGTDSANYTIGNQITTATINKAALTLTASSDTKVYDRTTTSSGTVSYSALVTGDSISGLTQSFDGKNVQGTNGSTLRVDSGYTLSDGNSGNNYAVTLVSATGTITPKNLTLSGASGVNKTYDGTISTTGLVLDGTNTAAAAMGSLGGVISVDTVTTAGAPVFTSANVARDSGTGAVITQAIQRGTVALSGTDAGNYNLSWTNGSGTINPATLTVRANNEAKFVTQADPTFSASYSGFVNGETATTPGVLSGTLAVTRSPSGPDGNTSGSNTLAGTYTGAITASGLAANNYTVNYAPGNFTIASSDQLIVRASGTSTYGSAAAYNISSASYWDQAANSGAGAEVVLTGITPNGNNNFTVPDGASASATFTLAPANAQTSGAGQLKAGSYQLATSGTVLENSGNFSNSLVVVGTHQVNQAALTPLVNTEAKTKTYDGTAAMNGLNLDAAVTGVLTRDVVTLSGSGTFSDKNVSRNAGALAANKSYTVSGIGLSGADASNYYLLFSSISGSDGQITPKTLTVAYTGVDKGYDGLSTASVTTSDNRITGDTLSIVRTANFVSTSGEAAKNVLRDTNGNVIAKNINITGAGLSGADVLNYDLASTTGLATAQITPASLVISGIVGTDKTYDKTTIDTLNVANLQKNGLVSGDTVTVNATGAFAEYNASLGKAVMISSSYSGADAGNYTITGQTGTTASIFKREVTVSAAGGISKVYDGTTDMNGVSITVAAVNGVAASGVVTGDTVSVSGAGSFSSANVSRDANDNVLANKSYTLADLQLSGTSASNYMIVGGATSITGSDGRIDPKTLTLTGFAADNKVYDGTVAATVANAGSLSGVVGTDAVNFNHSNATFSSKSAADNKTVTLNGISLSGGDISNYTLSSNPVTTLASIHQASLTVTANADTKTYDGTLAASGTGTVGALAGAGDTVNSAGSQAFTDKNAGIGNKTVQASGVTLKDASGADMTSNYAISYVDNTTSTINKATLTVTGTSVANKVYDGTTTASLSGGILVGVVGTEDVTLMQAGTFADKNVDTGKVVTAADTVGGTDVGNYTLTQPTGLSANITPKAITVSGITAAGKVYDGSTSAAVNASNASGWFSGDQVTVNATGVFDTRHVGTGKTVTLSSSYTGNDIGNYTLTDQASTTADVSAKTVSLNLAPVTRVYNGQTLQSANTTELQALDSQLGVTGDSVSAATLTFDNKNVGTGKSAALSSVSLNDGNGGRNYVVTLGSNNTSAITRLNAVTWTGGSSGNWFDPANWAGGAVPDLANVANVVIPSGVNVSFNSASAQSPVDTSGVVSLDSLGAQGSLTQANGTLNIGSGGMLLASYTQSGGALNNAGTTTVTDFSQSGGSFSGTGAITTGSLTQTGGTLNAGGNLTVSNGFSQGSTGSINVAGNTSITDTSGGVQLGNLNSTGPLSIISNGGAITQAAGTSITALDVSSLTASTGSNPVVSADIVLSNADNNFVGTVSAHGASVTLNDINSLTLGNVTATSTLAATAATDITLDGTLNTASLSITATTGGINQTGGTLTTTTGPTHLTAATDISLVNANDFNGTVNASGNKVTLNDVNSLTLGNVNALGDVKLSSSGALDIGNTTAAGNLLANSGNDNMTQSGALRITGHGTFIAGAGEIVLTNAANSLPNGVTVQASRYTITGDTRKLAADAAATVQGSQPAGASGSASAATTTPQPLVLSSVAPSSSTESATAASSPTGANSAGVTVDLHNMGQQDTPLMVAVSLPKGASTVGTGFSFELPETVKAMATQSTALQITQSNGSPLPSWLKFDQQGMRFEAAAVPDSALPMQLVVAMAGQRVTVVISERTE